MDFDTGSGWKDPDRFVYKCPYCKNEHEGFADCEEGKAALEEMKKRGDERRRQRMHEEMEWPRPEYLVKRWQAHGLDCAIQKGHFSLCGYVRVPPEHPDANTDYDDVADVSIHGGLTFTCKAEAKIGGGRWFGFDTGHGFDWFGYFDEKTGHGYEHPGRIWTLEDVEKETDVLAAQLAAKLAGKEDTK